MNNIQYLKKEFISPEIFKGFMVLLFFTIIGQILGFAPSYLFGQLINGLQSGKDYNFVLLIIGIFVFLRVIKTIINLIETKYDLFKVTFNFEEDFNERTLKKINQKPYSFFVKGNTSKQIRQIDKGFRGLRQLVYQSFFWFIPTATMVLITCCLLLILYPVYGLIAVIMTLLYSISVVKYWKAAKLKLKKFSGKESQRFGAYSDLLKNSSDIKITNGTETHQRYVKRLKGLNNYGKKLWWGLNVIRINSYNIGEVGMIAALLYGAYQVIQGDLRLGDLTIIYFWVARVLGNISNTTQMMNNAVTNISNVSDLVELLRKEEDGICGDKQVWLKKGDIVFDDISFSYPNSSGHALNRIKFKIPRGEFVAFVGPSGAGKSTIFKMILQGIRPASGCIKVDTIDLSDVDSNTMTNQIAYIPQEKLLFNLPLRMNVLLGISDQGITDEEIREVFEYLGLSSLSNRLHLPIGENGKKLSGGERQRVLMARALLKKNASLILMDEPTSDLDSESEQKIREAISKLKSEGKTIVMIAHRLTVVQDADKIFLIENGSVKDSGTHLSLIKSSKIYSGMVKRQSLAC